MTPAAVEFQVAPTYEMLEWSVTKAGGVLHIDDYENMPTESIASVDVETNGKAVTDEDFKIVCIGICGNGVDCCVYFDIRPELVAYLRTVQIIAHDGKRAEIPWLSRYGVTIDQLYFDTKTGYYNYDSARKNYGLKSILKEVLGVEYPTYPEIIADDNFIRVACATDRSLLLTKRLKPTKKFPEGVLQEKLPKEVLLDRMPQWVVAEYNACDIFWTFKLWVWLRQHYTGSQKKFFRHVEMPETQLIYHMENQGVKIDRPEIFKLHRKYLKDAYGSKKIVKDTVMGEISRDAWIGELANHYKAGKDFSNYDWSYLNLNSWRHVLAALNAAGVPVKSTDETILTQYKDNPIIKSLLDYRGQFKITSTYTKPLFRESGKNKDGRVHARFTQSTVTGRLASSDPVNLQNQPQEVRGCFIAECGCCFVNADWSNIELRFPAHFSGEPKFLAELSKPDGDLHTCTANFIYGGDIRSLTGSEYDRKRNIAKTCNFLLTNSGTAERLAVELECSVKEAKEIFRLFWEGYPTLAAWLAYEKRQARILGGIGTWFGRWVNLPDLKLVCFQPWKCGKPYIDNNGEERTSNCKNCIMRQEAERSAMSIRVQGTAADMCKMAAIRLWREYGLVPNLKVHDEMNYEQLLINAPQSVERIKYVMENVAQLKVPLVADIGVGFTWREAKKSCTSLTEVCMKKKCLRHKTGLDK